MNPVLTKEEIDAGKTKTTYKYYFDEIEKNKVTDNFLVCALLDQRGGNDGSKENIFFKSEVAVKDDTYGWIMWNGLSATKGSPSTINLEYRLLLLKKDNNTWKIDKGFGWTSPTGKSTDRDKYDQLYVKFPIGDWKTTNQNKRGYSSRKVWSGIAKVDTSSTTTEDDDEVKHLLSSLNIYMQKKDDSVTNNSEFFGSKGSFSGSGSEEGYQNTNKYYDSNSGWKTISSPIQLGDSLKKWYEHQMDKNLKWMTCDQWARGENQSDWEVTMKDMCYSAT